MKTYNIRVIIEDPRMTGPNPITGLEIASGFLCNRAGLKLTVPTEHLSQTIDKVNGILGIHDEARRPRTEFDRIECPLYFQGPIYLSCDKSDKMTISTIPYEVWKRCVITIRPEVYS